MAPNSMLKSCAESASQSRNGRQTRLRLLLVQPLEHHGDREDVVRPEGDLLAPVRIEEALAVEADDPADQPTERGVRRRLDRHERRSEEFRQIMGPQRKPGHHTEATATAALEPPEQVRIGAGIRDPHGAIGGDDLGLQQARRRHPVRLREASEAAALDQAGDAHGHAAAALDVAACLRRDGIVDLAPDGARLDRDCWLRLVVSRAADTDERIVHGDRIHLAGPDQQRVRRVGCALVAVAAGFHDEPQIVPAGEIDRGDDIVRRIGGHRVHARTRGPGADPAKRLRQPDLVAKVVRVLQILEHLSARGARRSDRAGGERRAHLDQPPPDIPAQPVPVSLGWPCRIAGPDAGWGSDCALTPSRSEYPRTYT